VQKLFELLAALGPFGVFAIATLDSAGVPLPMGVDALLLTVATISPEKAYFAAILAMLGSVGGNWFLFRLARKGGEKFLDEKTHDGRAKKFREWFQHYGLITVFIPTVVPIVPLPLKVFVLSAGALGVSLRAFLLTILIGRIPRFLAMAYLGSQLGEHSMQWLLDHKWHLSLVALGLFIFCVGLVRWADWRRAKLAAVQPEGSAAH
jgi:membrane protein DedA with SNARE-associated domain